MSISLQRLTFADIENFHNMMIISFKPLLEKYQDYDTNPGANTLERTAAQLKRENHTSYFVQLNGSNIGAFRIIRHEDFCELKQIFILPEKQGNGYAQAVISLVEELYPNAEYWELDTIKQEAKLCHFYEKLGYVQVGEERFIKDGMSLVSYRKYLRD